MIGDDVKEQLLRGDVFAAWDAAESFRKNVSPSDLSFLSMAYDARTNVALRAEIVDIIGLIGSQEACRFLTQIARSRDHYLVRYYAMRNLIDLKCGGWWPASAEKMKTSFYASLAAYEKYVNGEISLGTLRSLALQRTIKNGDHWEWMTHLSEIGRGST